LKPPLGNYTGVTALCGDTALYPLSMYSGRGLG
jgi:hypothetical protein